MSAALKAFWPLLAFITVVFLIGWASRDSKSKPG